MEPRQFPIPIATDEEIAAFIARYGRAYDPETDDYFRDPFIADIREGKNDPIYNAHSYHTKVPPRAIIPYILHYTEPGDIILDPFCGSGMTGVAALMCEDPPKDILASVPGAKLGARKAILNDLSPAACHIAYNYCTPVDVEALKAEFERIKAAVKEEFDWLYGTEHYEPAVGIYDPANPEVARRLKNPPASAGDLINVPEEERTWVLIERVEVERRMGPDALAKQPLPENVGQFICIPATIQYTVWSDVYKCAGMVTIEEPTGKTKKTGEPTVKKVRRARGCGGEIVLWDVAVDRDAGKVQESFSCPGCGLIWKKTQIRRTSVRPVFTNYEFIGLKIKNRGKNSQIIEAVCRTKHPTTSCERALIRAIESAPLPHDRPDAPFDPKGAQFRRNALSARSIKSVSDLYTRRNYRVINTLWKSILSSERLQPALLFTLTAIASVASRRNRWPQFAVISGTIYIPSVSVEMNVWEQFLRRHLGFLDQAEARQTGEHGSQFVVRLGDATNLSPIPSDAVDYVFADPPFGSNFYYSEVNLLWEYLLSAVTDERRDAIVHREEDGGYKDLSFYRGMMQSALSEIYRVLKPGRWATVEFNNSDGNVFEAIKQAARNAGFVIENMVFLDKVQKTFKQLKGDKGEEDVVGHDVIFNLRKPAAVFARIEPEPGMTEGEVSQIRSYLNQEIRSAGRTVGGLEEHLVVETIREHLRTLPDRIQKDPKTYSDEHRTTPFLNTMLMNALIPKGVVDVSRLNLPYIDQVCARYFRKVDNRWFLRDEVVGNHKPNGDKGVLFKASDDEVTIQDETSAIEWLRQKLTATPMRIGELRPHWMRATVKLTNDVSTKLDQFLREHFWLDRKTSRWREPSDEERAQMDTTERLQARHDAERFLAGQLRRHPEDEEILGWIEHLYKSASLIEEEAAGLSDTGVSEDLPEEAARLYAMMPRLFQGVLKENVSAAMYSLAQRQCRIVTTKLAAQAEREKRAQEAMEIAEEMPLFRDTER